MDSQPNDEESQLSVQRPSWLPDIVPVNGIWEQILARLYRVFDHDFRRSGCRFGSLPVWWDRRKLQGEKYEEGFWHLITKFDHTQGARLLDPRRAERLPWCKPTIQHLMDTAVRVWDYSEGRQVRTYVWLESWDYVIILEKRNLRGGREIAFLITAYHVGGNQTRNKLMRKYRQRVQPT